ncbi:MAG: TIM barrel protein [Acidobacteriaceae bacterium]
MNRRDFNRLLTGAAIGPSLLAAHAQSAAVPMTSASKTSRFSVMLWTIDRGIPFERSMEIVAAAGYQGIELIRESAKWSPAETRHIKKKLSGLGLTIDSMACIGAGLADPAGADRLATQLTKRIAVAKDLECPQIILTSGMRMGGLTRETQHAACIENLKRVADLVSKNDMELVIEPIDLLEDKFAYLNSVAEGFDIVRAVGSPNIKVLYDFYHEQRAAGNLIDKLERNIEWVGLVHIADVPGRHEPGTGEIDYRNIYRKLAELNYDRFITMEYFPTTDPMESLKTARLVALQAPLTPSAPYKLGSA